MFPHLESDLRSLVLKVFWISNLTAFIKSINKIY